MTRTLLTGCSSGIGRALALELHDRGHEVIATARRPETLADLPVAMKLALDVTDQVSIDTVMAQAGQVDFLVNNAGFSIWGPIEAVAPAQMQQLFDTNVFGAMRMVQAVLPQMRQRGAGGIVQISSAAARRSTAMLGHYAASKAALDAYSEALRIEVAGFGIGVSLVVLGAVETSFGANRKEVDLPAYKAITDAVRARIARSRSTAASPEEVARRIADVMARPLPMRIYASDDARPLIDQRLSLDDEAWERQALAGLSATPA
ncbi:SDR family oxidoreductase [Paracoccus pantotrophus]|uniref:SDR family oxidoreductase n=1 Tax=Paracoccus pantotrophus TaxID=82367 RepID=UPI0004919045|nr:SDR family oxidoreductase [Paracoccus pantotrophus]